MRWWVICLGLLLISGVVLFIGGESVNLSGSFFSFLSVQSASAQGENIISINSTYSKYGFNQEERSFTNNDGLREKLLDNGLVRVYNQINEPTMTYGVALTGIVNGQDYLVSDLDYSWNWSRNLEQIYETYEAFNYTSNETYNYTVTYIEENFIGDNQDSQLGIIKYRQFYPHKKMKTTINITNNLANPINDMKLWQIMTVDSIDSVRYKNRTFYPKTEDYTFVGNFNDEIAEVDFTGGASYLYDDALANGFDLVEIRVGNATRFGFPDKRVIALGFTKGTGTLNPGVTISFDPTSTGYKSPGTYKTGGWTNPTNLGSSDDVYTTTTTISDYINMTNFNFGVSEVASVRGIQVFSEGRGGNSPCGIGEGQVSGFSWHNTTTWSDLRTHTYTCKGVITLDDTFTDGNDSDLWGIASDFDVPGLFGWRVNNANFTLGMNYTQSIRSGAPNPGMDQVKVLIWYVLPPPEITFVSPTPANASTVSSTITVNITSDLTLANATLETNISGTWMNYTMDSETDTVWSLKLEGLDLDGEDGHENGFLPPGGNNGSVYQFRVRAETTANYTTTNYTILTVESSDPTVEINSPTIGEQTNSTNMTLSWNTTDTDGDSFDTLIYASFNDSSFNEGYLIERLLNLDNGTHQYNLTHSLPILNDSSLYGYWKHDERTNHGENSTYSRDWSDGELNGTLSASPNTPVKTDNGKIINSYAFDGTSDNIQVGNSSQFSDVFVGNEGTISAWIYPTATSRGSILARYNNGADDAFFRFIQGFSSTTLNIGNGTDFNLCTLSSTTVAPLNEWTHALVTYNGTGISYWQNGVFIEHDVCATPNSVVLSQWQDNSEPTFIGANTGGTFSEWMGNIDEVAIWNRSLEDVEIENLYNLTNGTHYWVVNSFDSPLGNGSVSGNFVVGSEEAAAGCNIDCTVTNVISGALDCLGEVLQFHGTNRDTDRVELDSTADIYNYPSWSILQCTVGNIQRLKH